MLAAAEKNLPIFVPGWEDATLGNMYTGHCLSGDVKNEAYSAYWHREHRVHDAAR